MMLAVVTVQFMIPLAVSERSWDDIHRANDHLVEEQRKTQEHQGEHRITGQQHRNQRQPGHAQGSRIITNCRSLDAFQNRQLLARDIPSLFLITGHFLNVKVTRRHLSTVLPPT